MDEVGEESKTEPKWPFGCEEVEARKHQMVRAVEVKKKFHVDCRVCVKLVKENQKERKNTRHCLTDKFM